MDEADRLTINGLEQQRSIFDRSGLGKLTWDPVMGNITASTILERNCMAEDTCLAVQ